MNYLRRADEKEQKNLQIRFRDEKNMHGCRCFWCLSVVDKGISEAISAKEKADRVKLAAAGMRQLLALTDGHTGLFPWSYRQYLVCLEKFQTPPEPAERTASGFT